MTIPEFLERLRKTPAKWRLIEGEIRCEDGKCPICRVANDGSRLDWYTAYYRIGLSESDAHAIAVAADSDDDVGFDHGLRQQLLAATVDRQHSVVGDGNSSEPS